MLVEQQVAIIGIAVIGLADVIIVGTLLFKKLHLSMVRRHTSALQQQLIQCITIGTLAPLKPFLKKGGNKVIATLFESFAQLSQSITIPPSMTHKLLKLFSSRGMEERSCTGLTSRWNYQRALCAVRCSFFSSKQSCEALQRQLITERSPIVRFYIAYALTKINNEESLPILIESLIGSTPWYQEKVCIFIARFKSKLLAMVPQLIARSENEIKQLLFYLCSEFVDLRLRDFLLDCLKSSDKAIMHQAAAALQNKYFYLLNDTCYFTHDDPIIRKSAIAAAGRVHTRESLIQLLSILNQPESCTEAINAITAIINHNPGQISLVIDRFNNPEYDPIRSHLVTILSNRIEYLILKLMTPEKVQAARLIAAVCCAHRLSSIIGFLNRNKNRELENELLVILKEAAFSDPYITQQLGLYLDARILTKLTIVRLSTPASKRQGQSPNKRITLWLSIILVFLFISFPLLFLIVNYSFCMHNPVIESTKLFIVDFNYLLIYYSFTINAIYLILLFFSSLAAHRYNRYNRLKMDALLFEKRIMPSISIVAPA
ncbi:MAG: HEAT repeat domain-containing protein, partial [Chitinivibrionales bacterium]|nr:HEAT repeat domain-containing protein [Chitinivibrionales bacterium]